MKKWTKYVLIAGFWLLVWWVAYRLVGKELILPSPFVTLRTLMGLFTAGEFYANVAATLLRVICGVGLSFAAGILTAIPAYFFRPVREVLKLPVNALKSMPVMSVILFAILWLTSNLVPVFACFLMCYPVCYTNVLSGMDRIDRQYLELCQVYSVGRTDQLFFLYLPGIRPEIRSALSLVTGLSWKSVVAAEVLAVAPFSMGYQLMLAKSYLETDRLFAWTIGIILFSLLFESLVNRVLRKEVGQ